MAEPGLVSSMISIVGFALDLSKKLYQFAATTSTAGEQIGYIAKHVTSFADALELLAERLDASLKPAYSIYTFKIVTKLYDRSCDLFDKIEDLIPESENGRSELNFGQQIIWTFKKGRIEFLAGQIECLTTTASLIAAVLFAGTKIRSREFSTLPIINIYTNRIQKRVTVAVFEHQQASNRLLDLETKAVAEDKLFLQANGYNSVQAEEAVNPSTSIFWTANHGLQSHQVLGADIDLVDHKTMVIQESESLLLYLVGRFTTLEQEEESHVAPWSQSAAPKASTPSLVEIDNSLLRGDPATIISYSKTKLSDRRQRVKRSDGNRGPDAQEYEVFSNHFTPDVVISSAVSDEVGQTSYTQPRSGLKQTVSCWHDDFKHHRRPSKDSESISLLKDDLGHHAESFTEISPPDTSQGQHREYLDEGFLSEEEQIPYSWQHHASAVRPADDRSISTGQFNSGGRRYGRDDVPNKHLPPHQISFPERIRKRVPSHRHTSVTASGSKGHGEQGQNGTWNRMEISSEGSAVNTNSAPETGPTHQIRACRRAWHVPNAETRHHKSRQETPNKHHVRRHAYVETEPESESGSQSLNAGVVSNHPPPSRFSMPSSYFQSDTETTRDPQSSVEDDVYDIPGSWSTTPTYGSSQPHSTTHDPLSDDDDDEEVHEAHEDDDEEEDEDEQKQDRHRGNAHNYSTSHFADSTSAMGKIQALQRDFHMKWLHTYSRAKRVIPPDTMELRQLSESIMFYIVEAADAIDSSGDTIARMERKRLLADAEMLLEQIDRDVN